MITFKRKIYKRGSSFETTLPSPLLFTLDSSKKYFVVFKFDSSANKWYVEFEDAGIPATKEKNTISNQTRTNSNSATKKITKKTEKIPKSAGK